MTAQTPGKVLLNSALAFIEHGQGHDAAAELLDNSLKQARHDERLKFAHKPCRHSVAAADRPERDDLRQWQTDQHEWFDPTILEIVSEYAQWRDKAEQGPGFPVRDEWGMSAEDWRWQRWECERERRVDRWKALKAIWGQPIAAKHKSQYVTNVRGRGDDWTPWRAICATIGVVLDRNWTDDLDSRWRARGRFLMGTDMAYWDNRSVYGGYEVTVLSLYPRCRISISNDGETFL